MPGGTQRLGDFDVGYDLKGPGREFHWSSKSWLNLLELARRYGWSPAGTKPDMDYEKKRNPDWNDSEWDGSYFWGRYQIVTEEDALNLAEALEKALPDIPREGPTHKLRIATYDQPEGDPITGRGLKPGETLNILEWFSGSPKERIAAFIRFLRAGAFRIE
jgi:hypothetical protein